MSQMQRIRKPQVRYGYGGQFTAVFSNVGSKDPNAFYLLTRFISKSGHPVPNQPMAELSVEKADRLLKKRSKDFYYKEL